jgi:hypothetical protein
MLRHGEQCAAQIPSERCCGGGGGIDGAKDHDPSKSPPCGLTISPLDATMITGYNFVFLPLWLPSVMLRGLGMSNMSFRDCEKPPDRIKTGPTANIESFYFLSRSSDVARIHQRRVRIGGIRRIGPD